MTAEWLRRRLERFGRVPPVAALVADLRETEQREARGEPAHWGDTIVRLMRVAVMQNTLLEERTAREKDESIHEIAALCDDVLRLVHEHGGRHGARLASENRAAVRLVAVPLPLRSTHTADRHPRLGR